MKLPKDKQNVPLSKKKWHLKPKESIEYVSLQHSFEYPIMWYNLCVYSLQSITVLDFFVLFLSLELTCEVLDQYLNCNAWFMKNMHIIGTKKDQIMK